MIQVGVWYGRFPRLFLYDDCLLAIDLLMKKSFVLQQCERSGGFSNLELKESVNSDRVKTLSCYVEVQL